MNPSLHSRVFGDAPELHYLEGPASGPPLLLLHGVARNSADWEPLFPDLLRDWRVIALDHRGHGQSARASRYLVTDYARDAAAFVRGAFSEPVTILGHSLGAMVALSVAAECPSQIAAIVLEDPPFHTMGSAIGDTLYWQQFTGMQEVARRSGPLATMTDALSDIRLDTPQGATRLGMLRDRASLEALAACLTHVDPGVFDPLIARRWLDSFDYQTLWPRVTCPTLLLQADPASGGAFTDADVAAAQRSLPNSRHIRFTGIGHQIHRTQPSEFLERFHEFTRRKMGATHGAD